MVTLYVIGAGCSKNYSQSIHGIPGLTSPTNDDFFKMAKKVVASRNLGLLTYLDGPLGHLIDDLCGLYGYPKDYGIKVFDHNRLKLEDVITHFSLASEIFDKKFFPPPSTPAALNRVSTLVELIAITLAVALEGPTCLKHKKLADLMSARDVIISYNYDILLDNALFETGKLTDSGYCIYFLENMMVNG